MVLCVGVVFSEMEWTHALREFPLIQNWVTRGLIYILYVRFYSLPSHQRKKTHECQLHTTSVGLLVLEEENEKNHLSGKASQFVVAAGITLCSMGCIYSCMVPNGSIVSPE